MCGGHTKIPQVSPERAEGARKNPIVLTEVREDLYRVVATVIAEEVEPIGESGDATTRAEVSEVLESAKSTLAELPVAIPSRPNPSAPTTNATIHRTTRPVVVYKPEPVRTQRPVITLASAPRVEVAPLEKPVETAESIQAKIEAILVMIRNKEDERKAALALQGVIARDAWKERDRRNSQQKVFREFITTQLFQLARVLSMRCDVNNVTNHKKVIVAGIRHYFPAAELPECLQL